jgi:ABC-type uncharacterized transport system fused permease/ATPase subunit
VSTLAVLADASGTSILEWVPVAILAVAGSTLLVVLATVVAVTWLVLHRVRRSRAAAAFRRTVKQVHGHADVLSAPAGARREAARLRRQLDKAYTNTAATLAAARGGSQGLSELSLLVTELRQVTDSWKRYLASLVNEPDEIVARVALDRARPDIEAVFLGLRNARSAATQLMADTIACDQAGLDQRLRAEAEVLSARGHKYRELTGL